MRRLPLTMGDGWCWFRMLSWLSQAVRVGAQCELKTIEAGVDAARRKQKCIFLLVEGSVLVLVEPGVYEEEGLKVDGGQCVSIWRCDRESESNKKEMAKVEWESRDEDVLIMRGGSTVSVNGMDMSAVKSEGYDGGGFNCVAAHDGAILSLELCDLTCECDLAVVEISNSETAATISDCCVHDGESGGVGIYDRASATLENNTITDNDLSGVHLQKHATATLTGNTIKGNGQCKIEQPEEELAGWPEEVSTLYRSPAGFPGVLVLSDSTVTMPPGSNTIEGNGKVGSSREQVMVDETSRLEVT